MIINKSILVLFMLFTLHLLFAQKDDVPLLVQIEDSVRKEKIVLYDKDISDTLKVHFIVKVVFEYPLKDSSRCITINTVELAGMKVISINSNSTLIDYGYDNENGNEIQRRIWDLISEKTQYWYRNQPYGKMISKIMYDKIVGFGGVLYILPIK